MIVAALGLPRSAGQSTHDSSSLCDIDNAISIFNYLDGKGRKPIIKIDYYWCFL
jgi:hypothetical protein